MKIEDNRNTTFLRIIMRLSKALTFLSTTTQITSDHTGAQLEQRGSVSLYVFTTPTLILFYKKPVLRHPKN